ncbi:hypothetical protein QJS10_CPA09g01186 [Acorus calamus]|uniref:Uncharacterized protein n=1 Tax=Acorus calamus TaxID=4465 RepID=A0AAV9E3T0_ACOCL|nr:hypothetical protein QJS10_CPA09g01186 [Acorus calamus]
MGPSLLLLLHGAKFVAAVTWVQDCCYIGPSLLLLLHGAKFATAVTWFLFCC